MPIAKVQLICKCTLYKGYFLGGVEVSCVFCRSNLTSSLILSQGHNIEQEQPFIMKWERVCCFDFPLQWWIMNVNCYVRSFWTLPWRQYVKGSIANKSKILFLGIAMDLNEKGSLLPSDSKGTQCDWKNTDLHLEPWQLGGCYRRLERKLYFSVSYLLIWLW